MTRSTCARTSGGIFDSSTEACVAFQTCSSWASRSRSSSSCVMRFVKLRFHSASSSRTPCHSRSNRRSVCSEGLAPSVFELSSRRALDSRVSTGRSCWIATVASSADKSPSMDWRLAKAASACGATSASGIAATFVTVVAAVKLLLVSSKLPCAAATNGAPPQSSPAAAITSTQHLNRRRPFVVAHNLSSDRCIRILQRP